MNSSSANSLGSGNKDPRIVGGDSSNNSENGPHEGRPALPPRKSYNTSNQTPPALPPRKGHNASNETRPDETASYGKTSLSRNDPRSSSQQSLHPELSTENRRKLLLIYVHGFMGNEMSFQSFPAHVHHLLTILLAETHVIHTKLYPRYPSRRKITYARDELSKWLEPHEDDTTDLVFLGHSMGGLLSVDVALMPPSQSDGRSFMHHVLGTINFDTPFLGMHPGVIKSGLASLFQSPEATNLEKSALEAGLVSDSETSIATSPSASVDPLWSPNNTDPNFNPSFENDKILPVRTPWRNALHFMKKHSGNLTTATKQLVSSHLEFGGAMAHYNELKARYAKIRALEADNLRVRQSVLDGVGTPPRIRFVNYYTASTGRPKKPVPAQRAQSTSPDRSVPPPTDASTDDERVGKSMYQLTVDEKSEIGNSDNGTTESLSQQQQKTDLVVNDISDNRPRSEPESQTPDADERTSRNEEPARPEKLILEPSQSLQSEATEQPGQTKPKDRKFCILPPKDANGQRDPCWVRVFMPDVDEVGAHCGLFFVSQGYERLVGDVAERIELWVKEDIDRRLSTTIGGAS